jgi:hypothetical protein
MSVSAWAPSILELACFSESSPLALRRKFSVSYWHRSAFAGMVGENFPGRVPAHASC